MRESPPDAGIAGYNGTVWGTLMAVDDSKKMQRVDARGLNGEMITQIERPQTYGFTSVPLPPDGSGPGAAEVEIGFRGGIRSHPVIRSTDDRRYRMKNLKGGESAHHDDQGQYSHLARDGHVAVAKSHSITAGSQPTQGTHELNDQIKGIEARTAHLEHTAHGLFDFMSQLNTIAMTKIPALAVLAPVLNQAPNGLTMMTQAIAGKEQAYLQQHIQDALGKFMSPTITGVGSVMGGADGIISALEAKISGLLSANPVVATVDSLVDELAALQASGSPMVVTSMAPVIQGLIDSATASNPIVGQVAQLRSQLSGLTSAAGDGLNFLGPQQRIPQRLSKALQLTQ